MNLIKKIEKDRIDKAVETIKGYCTKHSTCTNCRFRIKGSGVCVFEKGEIPCEWSEENEKT